MSFAYLLPIYLEKTAVSLKFNALFLYQGYAVWSSSAKIKRLYLVSLGYTLLRFLPFGIAGSGVEDGELDLDEWMLCTGVQCQLWCLWGILYRPRPVRVPKKGRYNAGEAISSLLNSLKRVLESGLEVCVRHKENRK